MLIAVSAFFFVILSPFALYWFLQIPWVYYSDFNTIKARLEGLPGTKIVDFWRHEDVTLEDFGFVLQVRQCQPIRLDFHDDEDLYRVFDEIDGITFSKPYNPAANSYETTRVSSGELAQSGIQVHSLADTIAQLEAVLAYLKNRPQQQSETPRPGAYYIGIFYELDAYKTQRNGAEP